MGEVSIRSLIEQVQQGQVRVPAFQRGFVWDHDRIAFLMDSIYKGYPFGSAILWQTKEQLTSERRLGPFGLPEPTANFPISYVLDLSWLIRLVRDFRGRGWRRGRPAARPG